jgi:hypothetical protein
MHGQWINVKPQLLDFRKSWIIITSNIGSGLLAGARRGRPLGFGSPSEEVDTQAIGNKALKEAFTYMPELLNRIPSSNRVTFDLLDADAMSRIFDKHMATLCPTASDEIQVTPRLKSWILSRSDPAEGGRHLMDVIREVLIKAAAPVRLKVGRGIPLVAGLDTSDGNLVRFAVLKDFMRPQSGFELSPPDKALQSVKLLTPAASGGLYLPPSYSR